MTFLGNLVGTAAAFSAIMLAVSIVIMYFVRWIHYLANVRGNTLGEMVGALNVGFRIANGDSLATAGDAPQSPFVTDVLSYPALHPMAKIAMIASPGKGEVTAADASRKKNAQSVEYIAKDDLLEIVCRLSGVPYEDGALPGVKIPQRWYRTLPAEKQTLSEFVDYIKHWFETSEGVSTDEYKKKAKRLTAVLACIVVVVLNMDGFRLVSDLYGNGYARDALVARAGDILDTARRAGATDANAPLPASRDALVDKSLPDPAALASLLNQPDFELGWQHSWIAEALCVTDRKCAPDLTKVPSSALGWFVRVTGWLAGLGFSSLLLSMGAPFWAKMLQDTLSLQSAIKGVKTDDSSGATSNAPPQSG